MLRLVRVHDPGDSGLTAGTILDKVVFWELNERLNDCVKVEAPGASGWHAGQLVPQDAFRKEQDRLQKAGREAPTGPRATPATCELRLTGITEAARLLHDASTNTSPTGEARPG
jgi:hypothetical protein